MRLSTKSASHEVGSNKHLRMIIFTGILLVLRGISAFIAEDNENLFKDCDELADVRKYGGPICGSDKAEYPNAKLLECLNYKNPSKNVTIAYNGPCYEGEGDCNVIDLVYDPVCGSDGTTYPNAVALTCVNDHYQKNVTIARRGTCETVDYCWNYGTQANGLLNTVCGSNGFTYGNAAQVKCLQQYGSTVRIVHDGGCTVDHVYRIFGTGGRTCSLAKTRYEWNPVCASDGNTYQNPFVFLCYHSHMSVIFSGQCNTTTQEYCVVAHKNDMINDDGIIENPDFQLADRVCANDGKTYPSAAHVECKRRFDPYIVVKHDGPCDFFNDDPCRGITSSYENPTPVCGNNGVTYISADALWCTRQRYLPHLALAHKGVCSTHQ